MSRSLSFAALLTLASAVAGCGSSAGGASVAATVNGSDISMSTYNKEMSYRRVSAAQSAGIDVCAVASTKPLCADLQKTTLNGLVDGELIRQYASRHNLVVTDAAFNRQWAVINKTKFHDQPRVVEAYTKRFGWTPADLKDHIRQDLLQQKVLLSVTSRMSHYTPAVKLSRIDVSTAQQVKLVRQLLAKGQTFKQVATMLNANKKSLCHQQRGCGTLGWLPTAFVPPGDTSVFTARPGQVVGPYIGPKTYELLRVEARDNHYRMTAPQEYRQRQQLFLKWLKEQERKATVNRHVGA